MEYSRRNFMKAAGVGAVAVTTTMGTVGAVVAGATPAAKPSPLAIPVAMTKETSSFNINGKVYPGRIRGAHDAVGSDRGEAGDDGDEPELQPSQLRGVQRADGWDAVLLLPHAGDGGGGEEGVHGGRIREMRRTCIRCRRWRTCTRRPSAGSARRGGK